MGPSLRVRPHRPTYMRLPKKTTKNLPKRNGEGGGRCLGTPTRPGWRVSAFRPTHRHHPHPSPMLRHQHPLSSLPRLPVCHHPQRVSPPAFSNPILWLEKLSPPNLQSDEARLSGTAGRPRPCRRPSLAPPLLLPPPTHTHICCVVLVGGTWTNEYILCMLPKTACLQRYNYKKARVQRTFYPISLYKWKGHE